MKKGAYFKLILLTIFLLTLGIIFYSPIDVQASWSTFRNSINRQGKSESALSSLSPLRWTSTDLGIITTIPVTDSQGNIYLGTAKGFTKINLNGEKVWAFKEASPNKSPTIDTDENIYFSTSECNPYVYSVDQNGARRWRYDLRQGGGVCGSNQSNSAVGLSPDQTTLYVGVDYPLSSLVAFNLDGTIKWRRGFSGNYPLRSSVAIGGDGTIYLGTGGSGTLYALDSNGTIKWYRLTASGYTIRLNTPLVDPNNNVYVTTTGALGGEVLVSYNSTGNKRWTYKVSNSSFSESPAIFEGIIVTTEKNNLLAINTGKGTLLWKWSAPTGTTLSSPVIDKNGVIYTSTSTTIYAVSAQGTLKSELAVANTLGPPIIGGDGLIYISQNKPNTSSGYLHALGQGEVPKAFYPVIFIPGIGGSEFKANQDIIWSKDSGHGGVYSHAYSSGEKIWVNEGEAASLGDDDYFDVLRLKGDGKTGEADIALTGNLTPFGYPDIDSFFQSLGYEKDKTYFIFPYDWRKDIRDSEGDLNSLIDQAIQKSGYSQVNIVAHSMGGLVARNYIANSEKAKKVNKLISLGVPHLGSVKALKAQMYGVEITKKILWILNLGVTDSAVKDLFSNYPSAFELQPTKQYFNFYINTNPDLPYPFVDDRDIDNDKTVGPLNFNQIQTLLSNLKYNTTVLGISNSFWESLGSSLNKNNGVKLYHIVGSGQPTLGQLREGWLINWPLKLIPKYDETYINGDETVPLYSASLKSESLDLSAGAKIYYVEQSHIDLVKSDGASMKTVKEILSEGDSLPIEIKSEKILLEGQHLSVEDDADLDIYDSEGNHTGFKNSEEIETNIPNTFFNTLGGSKHLFIKSKAKTVKVKVSPKKDGKTNIKIRHYSQDKISKTISYKDIPVTQTTKIEFDLNPTSLSAISLPVDGKSIPPTSEVEGEAASDQIPPKTTIQISGDKDSSGNYFSSVTITLNSSDSSSGVLATYYSLDGGKTVNLYTGPFTISTVGTTTIQVTSTDKTGNEELPQTLTVEIASETPPTPTTSPTNILTPTDTPSPTLIPSPTPTSSSLDSNSSLPSINPNIISLIDNYPYKVATIKLASLPIDNKGQVLGTKIKILGGEVKTVKENVTSVNAPTHSVFVWAIIVLLSIPGMIPLSFIVLTNFTSLILSDGKNLFFDRTARK